MTDVLVCVKRVPESSGAVTLTADGQAVDGTAAGYTISEHESSAVELAIRVADATGGTATVLTVGPGESVEQLRGALALGCGAAVLVEADTTRLGPADVAREIAEAVRADAASGRAYGLILLGNDAADTGDFQVGIRLAYALDLPVVNGACTVAVDGEMVRARVSATDGDELYELPVPAVVTVLAGGVDPRYPTIKGRMAAKKIAIERRGPTGEPTGSGRVRLLLPEAGPSSVEVLGQGPGAAAAVVDMFEKLGVLR